LVQIQPPLPTLFDDEGQFKRLAFVVSGVYIGNASGSTLYPAQPLEGRWFKSSPRYQHYLMMKASLTAGLCSFWHSISGNH
jgi:hypothetical protein